MNGFVASGVGSSAALGF
nr:unnamed protein product [Callosobruchus analis]